MYLPTSEVTPIGGFHFIPFPLVFVPLIILPSLICLTSAEHRTGYLSFPSHILPVILIYVLHSKQVTQTPRPLPRWRCSLIGLSNKLGHIDERRR